jgi:isopenicillin N synthase-like dioxygenase
MMGIKPQVVVVDFEDLLKEPDAASPENASSPLSSQLFEAYGSSGNSLGVLAIRNVPGFIDAKQKFLPMAHTLAHLPRDYLEQDLTDKASMYNAGWSHGKEKLGDEPDWAKGSFYFNPLTDEPGSPQDRIQYPASYPCNKWPNEDILPTFQQEAKHLGTLMKDVVVLLSKHLDSFAREHNPEYKVGTLFNAMKTTEKAKGRLLYYFPLDRKNTADDNNITDTPKEDSWIGWHNDSGFLTALAGDMYVNDDTGNEINCPDPEAGLYVVDRNDQVIHVGIPKDCMAVQIGECVQILTGGAVVATPHCVRGASKSKNENVPVARISLPCFIDTPPDFLLSMPRECTREHILTTSVGSSRVPPLSERWTHDGMPFGDFLQKTFEMYYSWTIDGDEKKGKK